MLNTKFSQMLSAESALFHRDLGNNMAAVVVGKLISPDSTGNKNGFAGPRPQVKYLAHEFCSEWECKGARLSDACRRRLHDATCDELNRAVDPRSSSTAQPVSCPR